MCAFAGFPMSYNAPPEMRERGGLMNEITITDIYDIEPDVREGGLTEIRTVKSTVLGVEIKHAVWKPGHRSGASAHADKHELLIIESGTLMVSEDDANVARAVEAGAAIDIPPGQTHGHAVPQDAVREVVAWAIFLPVPATAS